MGSKRKQRRHKRRRAAHKHSQTKTPSVKLSDCGTHEAEPQRESAAERAYRAAQRLFALCKGGRNRKASRTQVRRADGNRVWDESAPAIKTDIRQPDETDYMPHTREVFGRYIGTNAGEHTVDVPMYVTATVFDAPVYTLPIRIGSPALRARMTDRSVLRFDDECPEGFYMPHRRDRRDLTPYQRDVVGCRREPAPEKKSKAVTVGECTPISTDEHYFDDARLHTVLVRQ